MNDDISALAQQIADELKNTLEEVKLKISMADIISQLQTTLSLHDPIVTELEKMGINLIYHNYNSKTGTLTLQRSQLLSSAESEGGGEGDSPSAVKTPLFTVDREDKTYQCYATAQTSDLVVIVEGSRYYCVLQEQIIA